MEHFLNWYALNNKNIILILSTVIGIGLIYIVYRVLFGHEIIESSPKSAVGDRFQVKVVPTSENMSLTADDEHKNEEIDSLLQMVESNDQVNSEELKPKIETQIVQDPSLLVQLKELELKLLTSGNELNKANSELTALKSDLLRADAEIIQLRNQLKTSTQELGSEKYVDTSVTAGEDLVKKIEDLQNKLQEYDIIAEDISELQSLRKENIELKKQMSQKST